MRTVKKKVKTRVYKKESHSVLVNVKVTPRERETIQKLANRFAKGNLSAWIRKAAAEHKPNTL